MSALVLVLILVLVLMFVLVLTSTSVPELVSTCVLLLGLVLVSIWHQCWHWYYNMVQTAGNYKVTGKEFGLNFSLLQGLELIRNNIRTSHPQKLGRWRPLQWETNESSQGLKIKLYHVLRFIKSCLLGQIGVWVKIRHYNTFLKGSQSKLNETHVCDNAWHTVDYYFPSVLSCLCRFICFGFFSTHIKGNESTATLSFLTDFHFLWKQDFIHPLKTKNKPKYINKEYKQFWNQDGFKEYFLYFCML